MPAPARRAAAPPVQKFKFLDMNAYAGGGFDLPEGRWCIYFDFRFHAFTKQDGSKGTEMLGTMLTCYSLDKPVDQEPVEKFLSLGNKAKESLLPNADDGGKSLVVIPGGPGTAPRNTNSQIFFKSMIDAGMPPELGDLDDLTQIDGVWVSTKNIAEPEERKSYGNRQATGDVEEEKKNQIPQKIPNVVEIIEGGAPWEGGGGLTWDAPATPTTKKPAAVGATRPTPAAPRTAAPVARRPAPAPVVEEDAGTDEEAMSAAIAEALGTVIMSGKVKDLNRIKLQMEAFKVIGKSGGEEAQQALANMFSDNPDTIESMLGELGKKFSAAGKVVDA